ncbi:transcription factor bHLH18 [Lactuca sativa]|uniref:BHLH domain-containing protein n=1 Tax=Lactuca sativa TaxID=4236 RepID=A0A9R1X3R3_LACSA|nr:transcription factor bHLH18 [Lactuca sativa]KAJ0196849.1 hypothetical protein LSAT_V11C700374710 [Lactuca sativa]
MEISQFRGFSELSGIEDPCFNSQWPFNSFDDQLNPMNMEAAAFGDITHHLYNSHSPIFDHYKPILEPSPRPTKQPKTSSWNSCITPDNSMMNHNLHYANDSLIANQANLVTPKEEGTVSSKRTFGFACDSNFQASQVQFGNQNHHHGGGGSGGGVKPTTTSNTIRGPATPQDHILAERKRREKLSQRFIALSALVPGLKKMDKASVLGDAIKYLKTLQEKVKTLEEQTKKRSNTESVVFVKRYEILAEGGEISSSDENFSGGPVHEQLPEVEVRFSGKDVLIRVHCEKKTGVVEETLAEIEKLNLSIINTTAMTFASYALDITIVAQMDQEFTMTMKDLVKNLRSALKKFM